MAHNNNPVNWPQYLQANQQQHQQQRMLQHQEQQQRMLHHQQEQQRLLQQHEQQKLYQQQQQQKHFQQQQQQLHQDVKPQLVPSQNPQQLYPPTIDLTQIYEPVAEAETDADISRRIMMIDHLLNTYGGDNSRGQTDYDFPLAIQQQQQQQQQQMVAQNPANYPGKYKPKRGRRPKYCPTPSTNVNINMDVPSTTFNSQNQPYLPTVNNINVQTQNFNLPIFPQPVNYPYPKQNSVKITDVTNDASTSQKLPELTENQIKAEIQDSECDIDTDALIIDEDSKPDINLDNIKPEPLDDPVVSTVKTEEPNQCVKVEYPELTKLAQRPRIVLSEDTLQPPGLQDIINKSFTASLTSMQGQLNMINRANLSDFVKTGQQILVELMQHCEEILKIFKASTNLADNQMRVQTHLRCIRLLTQNISLVFRKCSESSAILEFGNEDDGLINRLLSFADSSGEDLCAGFDERFRARMQLLMRNTELKELVDKLKGILSEFNAKYKE